MAKVDLQILSVKLNGVDKLAEFENNDLFMTSTDIVRIEFDGANRMKSDNEFIGIAMGFDDGDGKPYYYPAIYTYINGVRTKVRDIVKYGASTLEFIYSKSFVDNIVEFSGVACNFTFANFSSYDGYSKNNKIQPTITISSKNIADNPIITLNSTSDENGYLKAQLWQDGKLLAEQTKTVVYNSSYTFTFTDINFASANDLTVKMLNKKEPEELFEITDAYNIYTNESIITYLKGIDPIISSFTVNGTSIDSNIVCDVELTDIDNWTIQAIQGGIVKVTKTYTTERTCTFLPGEIRQASETMFRLTARNRFNAVISEQTVTLARLEPKIIGLEPNGVTVNKDGIIAVTWSATYQSSFTLDVDGNVYTGTSARGVNLPTGTITSIGTKQITLTITYASSWGDVRTDTKTVNFIAIGKPRNPILDGYSYYSVSTPTFTFTSNDDYAQYRVQVLKDGNVVDDSGDVISTSGEYTCQTNLENNTNYSVQVKVKTQYGYWSDWSSKTFETNFVVANKPSIDVFTSNNAIVINSFTVYSEAFDHCDIYRRTEYGKWERIAYNLDNNVSYRDEYVGKEKYYYKVSSVSTSGGINDSDTADATIDIRNFNFANIEDIQNGVEFVGNPVVEITDVSESVSNEYAGVFAPISEDGEHNYCTCTCSFVCEKSKYDKFKAMITESKVLIYRDCRGEKIYCKIIGNIPRPKYEGDWVTISFSFVEVPFLEVDMYRGDGNQSLVFWDGTYKWDGAITWDGEGTLVE